MKKKWRALFLLTAILFLLLSVTSCAEAPAESVDEPPVYGEELSEYLAPLSFRGRTVSLAEGEQKDLAILRLLVAEAVVTEYPKDALSYYEGQIRAHDRYLAELTGVGYEEYLAANGRDEETVAKEAREMVRTDLVLAYVTAEAGLALSDGEKAEHYDRYADRYVSEYGYGREYVDEHMRDEVFESMQYDKTMEYLILVNTFEVKAS